MSRAWLGIDLGTQSVKALALDDEGAELASASAPLRSIRDADRHEQDPAEWIAAVASVVRAVTDALPDGVAVAAVAVDGTSGTLAPVDAAGRPTGTAAMYDDRRGAPRLAEVEEAGAEVWERLGYRMQSSWALPKALALLDGGATRLAHQTDVATSWLAGRRTASDLSTALKTGADLDAAAWPAEVFARLGIPADALPPLVESGQVLGAVAPDAAAATGLPLGCPIVAGSTDGVAAQLAAGALAPGDGSSVLGTTLVLKAFAAERRRDPSGAVYAHRAPFGGGWYPGGASSTGAGAVGALLPGRDLAAVTADAATRHGIPVAYPLVGRGERFPFVSDRASAFWPRDPATMEDGELFRAIAFGVAFVERMGLERMAELGAEVRTLRVSGGGARNPWWLRVRAAVSGGSGAGATGGRTLRVAPHTESAAGMAVLAAAALGDTPGDLPATARRMLHDGPDAGPREVEPLDLDPAEVEDAYGRFRERLEQESHEEAP